jgi:hypothetical protein
MLAVARASEHDRPDIKQAREEWTLTRQPIMRLEPHRLVFLDDHKRPGSHSLLKNSWKRVSRGWDSFVLRWRSGAIKRP